MIRKLYYTVKILQITHNKNTLTHEIYVIFYEYKFWWVWYYHIVAYRNKPKL